MALHLRLRASLALVALLAGFATVGVQLVRLGLEAQPPRLRASMADAPANAGGSTGGSPGSSWARPDIVDRSGRLMATDRAVSSLYADPQMVEDADLLIEKLGAVMRGLNLADLRNALSDRKRRFVWVERGLGPEEAQALRALALPGLGFRPELRRSYPLGMLAGHVLGAASIDNRGLAGIERMLDERGFTEPARGGERSARPPVRLTLDIGVQHAVVEELRRALRLYGATAAAAVVIDAGTGEIVAAVSLPEIDPGKPAELLDGTLLDRLTGGTFELGSIYKILVVALALESGIADLDTVLDVRQPLRAGPHLIRDPYPQGRALTVREVFLYSSNVGAGMMALQAGSERQRAFLSRLGLLEPMRTEAGPVAAPQLPAAWGRAETITIAYGHGVAVAPLQFAAAAATVVNGGTKVVPTFLPTGRDTPRGERVVRPAVSASMRELMRLGVTHKAGTGRQAEAEGYGVGGKTGTAELPGRGGYREKAVISSFLGAFPMEAPRYVTLVLLFEPQATGETGGRITAGVNAAPVTGRIVERIAPLLGVLPRRVERHARRAEPGGAPSGETSGGAGAFDAPPGAQ